MAFSGLHVTFGYVGGPPNSGPATTPIYGAMTSADDPATGTTSTASAPTGTAGQFPMASVYAAADSWLCVGASPSDPLQATSVRRFIPATTVVDFFCAPGDKIKWVAA